MLLTQRTARNGKAEEGERGLNASDHSYAGVFGDVSFKTGMGSPVPRASNIPGVAAEKRAQTTLRIGRGVFLCWFNDEDVYPNHATANTGTNAF